MTILYLNGKRAVIDEKQTIKFVHENTYFTKSGTYTYDITLPALCPENIAIFGHIYRKDQRKAVNTTFKARLHVDNMDILNGTATITNITDTSIKVQLMGGNSELNFYSKNENRFIDELPLGSWYDVAGVTSSDLTMRTMAEQFSDTFQEEIDSIGLDNAYKNLCRKLWNVNTKEVPVDWVALPCVNENYDVTCNNFGIRRYQYNDTWRHYTVINDLDTVCLSAQPYLVPMIERIFKHLGYPIAENCLRDNDFFMKLVIVTANNRAAIARALPHWTVTEFIEEIENLFAVVIYIDERTKKTSIKARANFFKSNIEYIDEIVDEYSVTMEVDSTNDITNANVGYAEVSEYDRIEDDIRKSAKIDTSFDASDFTTGLQNLVDHLYRVRKADKTSDYSSLFKYKGTIFKICGRSVIIELYDHIDSQGRTYKNHARTIFIDEFADRINVDGKSDIDIELRICPSKTTRSAAVPCYDTDASFVGDSDGFHLVKADNTDPAGIEAETNAYIAGLISGETEKVDTKEDIMSICIYDGGFVKRDFTGSATQEYPSSFLTQIAFPGNGVQCFYPAGYLMYQWQGETYTGGGTIQKFANESLSLNIDSFKQTLADKQYSYRTFYSEVYKKLQRIDTQVKYCIKFFSNKQLRVNSTFVIRNKKFVCEKLEYNIKTVGTDRLITGYFYELE